MNKVKLAEVLAAKHNLDVKLMTNILASLTDTIIESLKQGEEVTLTGFGTFMAKERHARMGINPRNPSEKIQMPAVTVAKFKTGKNLKEALKNSGQTANKNVTSEHAKTAEISPATPSTLG